MKYFGYILTLIGVAAFLSSLFISSNEEARMSREDSLRKAREAKARKRKSNEELENKTD